MRDELLRSNPAAKVHRPVGQSAEAAHLTPDDVMRVIVATADDRLGPLVLLLAHTGLRIGEALALRWQDVDLDRATLTVAGTLYRVGRRLERSDRPKTRGSIRSIPLTRAVVEELRRHRRRQDSERATLDPAWAEYGLVFTTEIGTPIDHSNALRWFKGRAAEVDVTATFHTLRHSAATTLMAAGVPLPVISRVLGHSSVRVTGDIYAHVSTEHTRDAVDRLGDALTIER